MKTLVLDKEYKPINFIKYRKLFIFILKDKVEPISYWDECIYKDLKHPAVVRLKEYIRKQLPIPPFNRTSLFRKDNYTCQYTGRKLSSSELSMDHVIPESRGGETSWYNCVTAWNVINYEKGNRTPEECGLKLIKKPKPPSNMLYHIYEEIYNKHPDWKLFFKDVD